MIDPGGLLSLVLLYLIAGVQSLSLSAEDCILLGLNKANLLCSSCNMLKDFNLVDLEYVRGADPVIKLMDEDGEVLETLAIDKWNTDSVEEFLQTYLIMPNEDMVDNNI